MSKQQNEHVSTNKSSAGNVDQHAPTQEIPTPTPTDSEGLPIVKEKPEFKPRVARNLISGAEFHKFEEEPTFIGIYRRPVIREKDGPNVKENPNEKAGTIMGYQFTELLNFNTPEEKEGYDSIVGNSEQIKRALEHAKDGEIYRIEFLGKTQNSKKQPVNIYRVDIME